MIIVTGTKRSGTSMWMQILIEAGFPAFGEEFPRKWAETIKDANPQGFYESMFRMGINFQTNPHPSTGAYVRPDQVENYAVKVFIPGLARTDIAFVGKVIATVREWREYDGSLRRLHAMEDEKRPDKSVEPPPRPTPVLEWWNENYTLIRDIAIRGYPVHVQSYDGFLRDPEKVVRKTLDWLGRGDVDRALAAVKPGSRTQRDVEQPEIEPEFAKVFDELYTAIDEDRELDAAFINMLNDTHRKLSPRIRQEQLKLMQEQQRRMQERRKQRTEQMRSGEPAPAGPQGIAGGLGLHPGSSAPAGPEQVEFLLRRVPELAYLAALEPCLFPADALPDAWPPDPQPLGDLADAHYLRRLTDALDGLASGAEREGNGGMLFLANTLRHFLTEQKLPPAEHPLIVALYLRSAARKRDMPDEPVTIVRELDRFGV